MAERYIAPSSIGPATDNRKPTAFEKVQMWWASGESSRSKVLGTDGTVFAKSSYTDEDYLSDAQKVAQTSIDTIKKAQARKDKEERDKANLLFIQDKKNIVGQLAELQKDPIANSGSIQSMIDLLDKKDISELEQGKVDVLLERVRKGETSNPAITPQPGVPVPVRATEQPGATPTPGQQANGGGGSFVPPPEKNKPNQYTFADGHKEYDSTAIPSVLNNGKITPSQYFQSKGIGWKQANTMAKEMGMANYRGTPGQNYALVNYIEEKNNGNSTAGGEQKESNRKFDGIKSDVLPNRFTQEERDKVMAMTPEEQAKYVSERNVADLKKMLPGNVGLINKVFGTNYTSDDLTGGIGRATIMGTTGMTAKGMEVQKLIEGLNEATANKFMNKGAELDNAIIDDTRMNTGSVQSGRRKILEDMVDGRTPMGQGTTLDAQDQEYMQAYKDYKRVKAVSDKYNQKIGQYNSMDPNNVARNKVLVDIQGFVNDLKDTDPQSFQALQGDLDKIPEFISKGGTGKIPTATVNHPAENNNKIEIAPANNQNIVDSNKPAPIDPNKPQPKVYGDYVPTNPNMETIDDKTPLPIGKTPTPLGTQKNSGGYTRDDGESRVGYSSNLTSKG